MVPKPNRGANKSTRAVQRQADKSDGRNRAARSSGLGFGQNEIEKNAYSTAARNVAKRLARESD